MPSNLTRPVTGPLLTPITYPVALSGGIAGRELVYEDFFAADGCSFPWYNYATYPAALYDAGTNCVFVTYQAWSGGEPRLTKVARINLGTRQTTVVTAGNNNIANDSHGVPSLALDHEGYLHVFYGPHHAEMEHSSSDAPIAASGAMSFTERAVIGSAAEDYTYPRAQAVGSSLYLFMRRRVAAETRMPLSLRIGSPSNGVVTWGNNLDIVNFGTDSRFYGGQMFVIGGEIWIFALMSDWNDTFRRDHYLFIYDPADGSVRNVQDTVTVAAGSLPMSLATADASFRNIDNSSPITTSLAAQAIAGDGTIHQVFNRLNTSNSELTDRYRRYIPASGFEASSVLSTNQLADVESSGALYLNADGSLDYLYNRDPGALWTFGGNVYRKVRSAAGVWGDEELIRTADTFALRGIAPVMNGPPNAKFVFHETTQAEATESGALKLFLWGDGGYRGGAVL